MKIAPEDFRQSQIGSEVLSRVLKVDDNMARVVSAVSSIRQIDESQFINEYIEHLRFKYSPQELLELYNQFQNRIGEIYNFQRAIVLRALMKSCKRGLTVECGVSFKHPESFGFGEGVFIGANAYLQGRFDGQFIVGDRSWLGPQSYYDCRALRIGKFVGIGPGVKFLGSEHIGQPIEKPIITTDLLIKETVIEDDVDIGTGAIILPGVTIGKGSIIGAGAVVNNDLPEYVVAVGVPAKVVRSRKNN